MGRAAVKIVPISCFRYGADTDTPHPAMSLIDQWECCGRARASKRHCSANGCGLRFEGTVQGPTSLPGAHQQQPRLQL